MEYRKLPFSEAESVIAKWRNEGIEETEPGVEVCDCPKQGIFDLVDAVSGSYEAGRYIGGVSGILMKCDICGKQVFATTQSHF